MKKYVNLKYMFTCNLNIARLHYMDISVRSTFQIAGRRSRALTQEILRFLDQLCGPILQVANEYTDCILKIS